MTIAQTLKSATAKLTVNRITDIPHLEAEILLAQTLKKPREFILSHSERRLTKAQIANYKLKIKTRLKGLPIAYITGEKEFYGLKFKIDKNVLIPRPETELMVEEALRLITHNSKPTTLIDIGTGSGCIIISLAKQLNYKLKITNHEFFATDISTKALAIAKQNAQAHGVNQKIKFIKGNLLNPFIRNSLFLIPNSLVILANLPYGWKEWKNNSSADAIGLKFEPQIALFTGKNGLKLYEKLFQQINCLLHNTKYNPPTGGQNTLHLLCEFDPRQTSKIKKLIKCELPQASLQIKKDLAGLNRLAIISLN